MDSQLGHLEMLRPRAKAIVANTNHHRTITRTKLQLDVANSHANSSVTYEICRSESFRAGICRDCFYRILKCFISKFHC